MTNDVFRQGRVLVVDDTPANLVAMQAVLAPLQVDVVTAASGEEAIRLASASPFAVILLDYMMPGMDGLATLEKLRAAPMTAKTPVILVTAFSLDPERIEQVYRAGLSDHVEKPLNPVVLRAKVTCFLEFFERTKDATRKEMEQSAREQRFAAFGEEIVSCARDLSGLLVGAAASGELEGQRELIQTLLGRIESTGTDLLHELTRARKDIAAELADADVSELVRGTMERFARAYPSLRLIVSVEPHQRARVDPSRITQLLEILVRNAIKHGTGWVRVELAATEGRLKMVVADGAQLSALARSIAFLPPSLSVGVPRGASRRSGLSIARGIARAHGGDIELLPKETETQFVVGLPQDPGVSFTRH